MGQTDMIKSGDKLPNLKVWRIDLSGTEQVELSTWLGTGKIIIFTLPGAYTPTCHIHHLPGYVANIEKFNKLGVTKIVCASVNDHYVMKAWADAHNALGKVEFLADFDANFARALGLSRDLSAGGLGERLMRTAIIIQNGLIQDVFVDDKSGKLTNTGAQSILGALN